MGNGKFWSLIVGGLFVAFFALSTAFGSFYIVDQSEIGVLVRNGVVKGTEAPSGLSYKLPFVTDIVKYKIGDRLTRWEKLEGYSHDQQASHYVISVNWRIRANEAQNIYINYGGIQPLVDRILTPNVLKYSKIVIGQFTAQTSVQNRQNLNSEILKVIEEATSHSPIMVTSVNVEDIQFDKAYTESINKRMLAEVNVMTETQNWHKEKVLAEIVVTKAKAERDRLTQIGEGNAAAIRLQGKAEADNIAAKAAALAANPVLIEYTKAEKWNGILPTTMLPGGAVPMVSIK